MAKKELYKSIVLAAIVASIIASGMTYFFLTNKKPTKEELIKDFYLTENAVYVSPHSLRRRMDKGEKNYVLVDLRSPQEYVKEHIVGAINIPAYKDPNTPAYTDTARILQSFRKLPKGKEIIVYCYSMPCMTGRKIGELLAQNGIFVKHLGIGWNEWRHFWTLWNHEHEWAVTNPEMYIIKGKDPGKTKLRDLPSSCGEDTYGC
ncbi:rhodanese-like domain-containing protein [Candidatus Roizmanbacteria bacterium]|nr:rhodanese-like domain-containing protein [Candidatus Roizmanbacteria bacterium]